MRIQILVNIAGLFGCFTGCASLIWQFWTYFDRRKEKIKSELSMGATLLDGRKACGLFLRLINFGEVPIYLHEVSLIYGEKKIKKIEHQNTALHFVPHPMTKEPLQPGDNRTYILDKNGFGNMFDKASQLPSKKIWISVKSGKGEILRIKGDIIKSYL
ncbi:MAG: hypothetical protein ACYC3B_06360 [Sedimentisphaerales bacterium]